MALLSLAFLVGLGLGVQDAEPTPLPQTQSWRIASFLEDAGLTERVIFDLAFQPDGTIWVAASDGLYRSHGYVWQRFTRADGLPSDHVRSVLFSSRGDLWVGTEAGAGVFDDQGFHSAGADESLAGPSVRRIVEGPPGTLWFCCDRWPVPGVTAGLTRFRNGEWTSYTVADGLPSDYVSDVFVDANERVYVMTRAGLAEMQGERFELPLVDAGFPDLHDYAWSMTELPTGEVLAVVGGQLFVRRDDGWSVSPRELPMSHGRVMTTRDGEVLSFLPGAPSIFLRWADDRFEPACEPFPYAGRDVQRIIEAPDGSVWAAGISLLVRWNRKGGQWSVFSDLPPPSLLDAEGGVWFGDDELVLRRKGDSWNRISGGRAPLLGDSEGVWMHARGGLFRWTPRSLTLVDSVEIQLGNAEIVAANGAGDLWVRGTDEAGGLAFSHFDGESWGVVHLPDGVDGGRFQSADQGSSGGLRIVLRDADERNRLFLLKDGVASEVDLPDVYRDLDAPEIVSGDPGEVFLYGFFGMFAWQRSLGSWEEREGLNGRHVSAVTRWGDELWVCQVGTAGGIGSLTRERSGSRNHFPIFARKIEGRDGNGAPLFASNNGVIRLTREHAPALLELPVPARVDCAVGDGAGTLWIGAGERVYRFQPDGVPPDTTVVSAPEEINLGEDMVVRFQGFERFRPLSDRAAYPVEIRIDGGDWAHVGSSDRDQIQIAGLEVGPHTVEVRVVDDGGDVDALPALLSVDVSPVPLQLRAWFQPALIVVFVLILGLAASGLFGRHKLREQARGLEETVRIRTVELRGSERKYRHLFEDSQDAILLVDAQRRIEDGNPAAEELFGKSRVQLVGTDLESLFDRPTVVTALLQTRDQTGFSSEPVTRSSERQHVLLSGNVRRSETGEVVGYQVICRDQTQQVEMEEQLRQTQKMEAVGRMAGGIAHDFNNILTAILGYCDLLSVQVAGNRKLEESLAVILDQARRAKALTSQIQVFSRSHVAEPRIVSLNEVVSGAEGLLRTLVGDQIELSLDPAAGQVRIDSGRLEQVVVNLAMNARDAMPEGGTISISTAVLDAAKTVLVVSDSGRGMDEETRRKIFEPFFSTKPPGEGTGLGLAIVYGIVDQVGGSIQVESTPGVGTTFAIQFQRCSEAPDGLERGPESRAPRRGSGTVLVVEDEPSIRSLIRTSLQSVGYHVDDAADGKEALKRVALRADPYDVVVADIVMPNMDGTELLERVRDVYPEAAFLFISGHPQFGGTGRTRRALKAPLLMKPFQLRTLIERVHALVEDESRSVTATPAAPVKAGAQSSAQLGVHPS